MIYVELVITEETDGTWIGEVDVGNWVGQCSDLATLMREAYHYIDVTHIDTYSVIVHFDDIQPDLLNLYTNQEQPPHAL